MNTFLLPVLFFFSGATSLVWESLWSRELHLIFGTSQYAITTVLCAFMAGLGLGAWIAARNAERITQPLRVYAVLEGIIGLYGLAFPYLLKMLEPVWLMLAAFFPGSPLVLAFIQFLLVGVALLVPCACMGATLPVLAPLIGSFKTSIARLYAINTVGAVAGTFIGGFYLIPLLFVQTTGFLTGATNLLLCGVAFWLGGHRVESQKAPELAVIWRPVLAAGLAGAASLMLEVVWFRVLGLVLGASVYAFSLMLLAFLVGIAGGGEWGEWISKKNAAEKAGLMQGLVAGLSYGAMWLYGWLPLVFVWLYFQVVDFPSLLWPIRYLVAMLVMTPPAIAMGATLPLLIASTRNHPEDPDHPARVGQIYAANTIGGVIGAFTAGFILLEKLQVVGAALVAILLNLIAVVVLVQRKRVAMIPVLGLLLWVWPPTWDPMVMSTGVYKYVTSLDNPSWSEMRRKMLDRYELLYYKEGLSSVVTVARNRLTGNIWLANNGKIDASTTADMPTQVLVTHLPFLFLGAGTSRPPPEKAQLIGLASGITLGALTLHRELKDLQVVEIEPGMPEAAQIFSSWHHDALSDPRVQLLANDGRNQLLLTPEKSLDLVISEPSNPWLTGVANLFTYEFFQMGKSRLIDGGVWSQWVQMYGMDPTDLRAILHTFTAVYRYVRVFATIEDADLVLVGSDAPLVLDAAAAARLLSKNVGVESELAQVGVHSVEDLLMLSLMDEEAISRLVSAGDKPTRLEAPLNTDNNLLVEYSAPRNLQRSTTEENMKMLAWFAQVPETVSTPDALLALGQSYQRRGDTVRALAALQRAVLLEPDREDLQDWRDAYKAIILTP